MKPRVGSPGGAPPPAAHQQAHVAGACRWEVLTDVGWAAYSLADSTRITDAITAGANEVRLTITTFGGEVTDYIIDLSSAPIIQRRADGLGRARPLRASNTAVPTPSAPPPPAAAAAAAAAAPPPQPAAPPNEFLCPITCELLRDPVVAADGFTYGELLCKTLASKLVRPPTSWFNYHRFWEDI